jgi:hypothetical protein
MLIAELLFRNFYMQSSDDENDNKKYEMSSLSLLFLKKQFFIY